MRIIIACETLKNERTAVLAAARCTDEVRWVESGLHIWPGKLHDKISSLVAELPPACDTVLLAFGFCGNALVGVGSPTAALVLPRVTDCIPLMLGSQQRCDEMARHTYFFTEGTLAGGYSLVSEHEHYRQRYNEQQAAQLTRSIVAGYKALAVIDTGAFPVGPVVAELAPFSAMTGLPVQVLPGDLALMRGLLQNSWDPQHYLRVPPGGGITLQDALAVARPEG